MTPEQQSLFQRLAQLCSQNPVQAILEARLYYQLIDQEMLAAARLIAAQAAEAWADEQRRTQFADLMLGYGPTADLRLQSLAQTSAAFYQVLARIAQHGGDPPAPAQLAAMALDVLQGRADPVQAARLAAAQTPGGLEQIDAALTFMAFDPAVRAMVAQCGMAAAAEALPRHQLAVLLGVPAAPSRTDDVAALMWQVEQMGSADPTAREQLLLRALDAAADTPDTADDVKVLQYLMALPDQTSLQPDTLRRCTDRACALVRDGLRGDVVATFVELLITSAIAGGLAGELGASLAQAGTSLLSGELSPQPRLSLASSTAEAWLRAGRADLAEQALSGVDALPDLTDEQRLEIARLEASALWEGEDREAAADRLVRALDAAPEAGFDARSQTIQKLLSVWPEGCAGVERWIGELEAGIDALDEPWRSLQWVTVAIRRQADQDRAGAQAAAAKIDLANLKATLPPMFAPMLGQIEAALAGFELAAPPPAEVAQTYGHGDAAVRLGTERRFAEAAQEAIAAAEAELARGSRGSAFHWLGAAGKFLHLAGQHADALSAFERAFDLLETDLRYQPRAVLAIRRLADWPEHYVWAAISALEVGDPLRAVSLAERGRCRAITHRIGPSADTRPPAADPELWERYTLRWRQAVAIAANELVDSDAWESREDTSELERELGELRGQLTAAGVSAEELAPVGEPVDVAQVMGRLRSPHVARTVVLYALRLRKGEGEPDERADLRLVRLSSEGATEIPIPPDGQKAILAACDAYVQGLRSIPHPTGTDIASGLAELLPKVRAPLGAAFEAALPADANVRLLWIPQGSLVAVPILACPVGDGMLVDRAAVMTAPSLTFGVAALSGDCPAPLKGAAVRGRSDDQTPTPTEGGDAVIRAADPQAPAEVTPTTLNEFSGVTAGVPLIHLSCHGVYDWSDPLNTYVKLGGDLDLHVRTLLDGQLLAPNALVVLGTCDSGTVAQTDINEAIGIPFGLLASGAHSVVGAAWPVARLAAVGICSRFMGELAAGTPSPEALQAAARWFRDATLREVYEELRGIGHVEAEGLGKGLILGAEQPIVRYLSRNTPGDPESAFARLWASYVHWGGGWRAQTA